MKSLLILVLSLAIVYGTPPPRPNEKGHMKRAQDDGQRRGKRAVVLTHKYIDRAGRVYSTKQANKELFDISATASCNTTAHTKGVTIVKAMLKNVPKTVFSKLAADAKVGIFSGDEALTVFDEYDYAKDTPACANICTGVCKPTCTGDGRKIDTLDGLAGSLAVVVDDNILCNDQDPYYGYSNILVHEFAHTIHMYGISDANNTAIKAAWEKAKKDKIWVLTSYAMSNEYEYFAEATGVFFNANKYVESNGGMSDCNGKGECPSESAARRRLRTKDPAVYKLLVYIYTNNRAYLGGGLKICM